MPAGRWVVGRHLGLTTSVGPLGPGLWGSGALEQRCSLGGSRTWTWTLDGQATLKSVETTVPGLQFKTLHLQTSTTTKVRHFEIDILSFFDGTMPPSYPPTLPPSRAAHPPPRASLCSNRDRRRHPALNPIHLHAAVDRHQPACVVPDMTRVSAWSAWLDPDQPSKPTPLSGWRPRRSHVTLHCRRPRGGRGGPLDPERTPW